MNDKNVKITFTGDLLVYSSLIKKSKSRSKYSFAQVFEHVGCLFDDSDYVVGNLETPLAGEKAGYTQMDMLFNTPDQFVQDAKDIGFSMFTTANNHCMDKGAEGLKRTIDVLDQKGIDHTGTFKTKNEKHFFIREIEGIKVAFIAFTYGTNPNVNGYSINKNNDYLVNITKECEKPYKRPFWKQLIVDFVYKLPLTVQNKIHPLYPNHGYDDNVNEEEIYNGDHHEYIENMRNVITQAKCNSDIIVVCLHAGGQFNSKVGPYTQYLINEIRKMSVDAIIVNHPHCVLGSKFENGRFEAWSLGNFCFTPQEGYFIDGVYGEYGVVVHLEIDKVKKKNEDVYFNVVKNIRLNDGRSQVVPVVSLIENETDIKQKEQLEADLLHVMNRFLCSNMEKIEIKSEYRYNDFKY